MRLRQLSAQQGDPHIDQDINPFKYHDHPEPVHVINGNNQKKHGKKHDMGFFPDRKKIDHGNARQRTKIKEKGQQPDLLEGKLLPRLQPF